MRFFILLSLLFISTITSAKNLRFAMLHNSEAQNVAMCVLIEAYKNIGIDAHFHAFPTTRSLMLSNSGEYDGETARVIGAKKKYTNLLPIETPTSILRGTAFTIKKTAFEPSGFQSLAPYEVIIKYAVLFAEAGTKGLPYVQKANSYEAAFKMLKINRADIVVAPYLNGLAELRKLKDDQVLALAPAINEIPLHHFLHKDHEQLVPIISAEMIRLEKSGRIAEIYRSYANKLIDVDITPQFNNGDGPSVPCV